MSTKINKQQREKETENILKKKKILPARNRKKSKMTLHKACTFFQYEKHVKESASSILNSVLPCNCNMPSSTKKIMFLNCPIYPTASPGMGEMLSNGHAPGSVPLSRTKPQDPRVRGDGAR